MLSVRDLVTPCFLVDQAKLHANIEVVADFARRIGKNLRPHAKTHKCSAIGRMQVEGGAVGLTVATPWEAEVLSQVTRDLFLARSVTGTPALGRIARLRASGVSLLVGLDSLEAAAQLNAAALAAGVTFEVRVEMETGQGRCGIRPEALVEFARGLSRLEALKLEGIFTHEGHVYTFDAPEGLRSAAHRVAQMMGECVAALRQDGHEIRTVSVGATPARFETPQHGAVTELRPGNYVFFDQTQILLGVAKESECAASVLTTVISKPQPGLVVVDAGRKAISTDGMARESLGLVVGHPEVQFRTASEEHGMLDWPEHVPAPALGATLRVIPYHVCPVTNLFDELILVEGEQVVEVLPVDARGYGPVLLGE